MKKGFIILLIASLIVFAISCSKGEMPANDPCDGVAKTFSADVNPLVQGYCNQPFCHHANSSLGPGPLTNYTQVFNARVSVRAAIASGRMPFGGSFTVAQKNAFLCWIDSGAPNN